MPAAPEVSRIGTGACRLPLGPESSVWGKSIPTKAFPGKNLDSQWLLRSYHTGMITVLSGSPEFKLSLIPQMN